jgi:hypothetical protein
MRVHSVRASATGDTIVETVLVHGANAEPAPYAPAALKVIGIDRDDDDDENDADSDHGPD